MKQEILAQCYVAVAVGIFNQKWTFFYLKSMNYRFLDQKSTKTIYNHFFTVLNRMDRLKHQIKFFLVNLHKKFPKKICNQKKNYRYQIGGTNRCFTLNRRRLVCAYPTLTTSRVKVSSQRWYSDCINSSLFLTLCVCRWYQLQPTSSWWWNTCLEENSSIILLNMERWFLFLALKYTHTKSEEQTAR